MTNIKLDQIEASEESLRMARNILPRITDKVDAASTMALGRQLEFVRAKEIEILYQKTRAFEFIDVATDVPEGAATYTYREWDETGEAKIIANGADDIPLVDALVAEYEAPIHTLAAAFSFTVEDLLKATFAKIPLQNRKTGAVRNALSRKIDQIAAIGVPQAGSKGFLNNPSLNVLEAGVDMYNPATTSASIEAVISLAINRIKIQSGSHYEADTYLMEPEIYGILNAKAHSQYSDVTVLEYLKKVHPKVKFEDWDLLKTADGGLARQMVFARSADFAEFILPNEMKMLPPQERNMAFINIAYSRVGGTDIYLPLAGLYVDNTGTPSI